ncbi:hypothetical protein AAG570_012554 [Ranatra chinensis]|uniref:Gag protein n=1 Tax=Ranatra chinensis TaxID=642074 RepID=A0ABD0YEU1_9HEMI
MFVAASRDLSSTGSFSAVTDRRRKPNRRSRNRGRTLDKPGIKPRTIIFDRSGTAIRPPLCSSEGSDANQATGVARSGQKASENGVRRTPHVTHRGHTRKTSPCLLRRPQCPRSRAPGVLRPADPTTVLDPRLRPLVHPGRQIDQFNLVVRSLDYEVIQRAADTVQFPGDQPYVTITLALIEAHSMSESDRAYQLLGQQTHGDRKPSEFLVHLRRLGGNALPPYLLRTLWMRAVPTTVRTILALSPNTDLQTLVTQALQVCPVVETVLPGSPPQWPIRGNRGPEVATAGAQNFRLPNPNRARIRDRAVDEKPASGTCFYHRQFGNKARRCQPPYK